jgi:hypothetical protein
MLGAKSCENRETDSRVSDQSALGVIIFHPFPLESTLLACAAFVCAKQARSDVGAFPTDRVQCAATS